MAGMFEGLFKIYPQLNNPMILYVILAIIALVVYTYFKKGEGKLKMKVYYFADIERLVKPLKVKELTPQNIVTEDDKKFWRRAKSWLWKDDNTSFVIWLGKVAKGITYRLETNPKDDDGKTVVEKIGSLYEGLKHCLDVKEADELTPQTFTPESLELLKRSEIFVCVDLEIDPSDVPAEFNEDNAVREANTNMANLIGMKIREQLTKEDWVRDAGLIGIGIAVTLVAQQMGIM